MPKGEGTYGSKRGRPPKPKKKKTVTVARTKSPTQYTNSTGIKSPQDEEESNYSYRTGVKRSVTTKSGKTKSKSISVGHKGKEYRRRLPSGAGGGIGSNEGAYKQTTKPEASAQYTQTKVRKSGKSVSKPVTQKKAKKFASKMAAKRAYTSSHKEAGGESDFGGKKGESSGSMGGGKGRHSTLFNIRGKNPLYMWRPKYD